MSAMFRCKDILLKNLFLLWLFIFLPLSLSLAKIHYPGQKQRWQVEPQGPEEAALQEDAAGALCYTVPPVSPTSCGERLGAAFKMFALR